VLCKNKTAPRFRRVFLCRALKRIYLKRARRLTFFYPQPPEGFILGFIFGFILGFIFGFILGFIFAPEGEISPEDALAPPKGR
jgi:hypothetical protein